VKSWKKRWKDELERIVPALHDDVKDAPIPQGDPDAWQGGAAAKAIDRRKWIPAISGLIALLLVAVILCVCLIKPSVKRSDFLFTLEINPTVTISTDRNGTVTGVIASNADADVILSEEDAISRMQGKSLQEAVTYFTDRAARLGYLDPEKTGSAVRISGSGSDEFLDKAQSALEDYFTQKGLLAVVISERVSEEEFSLRSGMEECGSFDEAVRYIQSSAALYSERTAEGASLEDVQALYRDTVLKDRVFGYVNAYLAENIERLVKNAEDIGNLLQMYFEIFRHEENPGKPFGDYWAVKKLYGDSLNGEFAELMDKMERALRAYAVDYGVEITGIAQLKAVADGYVKIPAQTLASFLEELSFDRFQELSSEIAEIMGAAGLMTEDLNDVMRLPQSLTEYAEKTAAILRSEGAKRLENYEEAYNGLRPIERQDYDAYVQGLIDEYGSLQSYWDSVKNKTAPSDGMGSVR